MTESRRLVQNIKTLLLTGIVGWIVSLYTLWHRAKVQAGLDLGQAFCNINAKVNCDSVALSSYSAIAGVSVSVFGMIFFTIVSILAMRALHSANRGYIGIHTRKVILLCGIVGALTSVALGTLSLTKIGAFCLVCGIVYLLSFSLLFLAWKVFKQSETIVKAETFSPAFLAIAIALIVVQYAFQPLADYAARGGAPVAEEGEALPADFLKQIIDEYDGQNAYEIPVQNSPNEGSVSAPVTVVEFSDFECPHCGENHKHMPGVVKSFGDQVHTIYKNYPLDPACNTGGMHHKACMAAYAARCVYNLKGLDSFHQMQDYLFGNQESFDQNSVKAQALSLGISESDYNTCIDSTAVKQQIADEIELGKSLGLEGTPAIYVNGRALKMGANPSVLKAVIKQLLKK